MNNMNDWLSNVPGMPDKKLTLDELRRLREKCVTGESKPCFPCSTKDCSNDGEWGVPGVGFFCKWHLPGDAVIEDDESEEK